MLRIHQITDTHVPFDDGAFRRYIEGLHAGTWGPLPDLIIHTGDIVNGAKTETELREQHRLAKTYLDALPVPYYAICHSHDRFGETGFARGNTFRKIIGQHFLQHLSLDSVDIFLISGSITCYPPYYPCNNPPEPPDWGYDLFDTAVLKEAEVQFSKATQPLRLLFYHHPIVPMTQPEQPVQEHERQKLLTYCIGEEGRNRIVAVLKRHGIQAVFGGHVHLAAQAEHDGIRFHTVANMQGKNPGFRKIQIDNSLYSSVPVWL